ncbi:MAG: riboflavin kinase, partial [Deltaproteobacteria bacterium]|nr:riboflavin kinase [Deltaproteobacteria bacterium]
VHLMDFPPENIYGQSLDVLFVERIREEGRFASPAELVAQISKDTEQARAILARPGKKPLPQGERLPTAIMMPD